MAYIGFGPLNTFSPVPSKDSFTGDGSTTTFDLQNEVVFGGENALEVFVDNVRQEPGTGKAYTLDLDGNLKNKRITFSAAPASGAAIYVINDKTSNTTIISPTDLNGVEFILDADADTSITADTDDRIDFKLNGTDHIQLGTSSGDTTIKIATDAKDLQFLQADGRNILEINDAGYVALGNGATGSGQLRIYEDTDNGTNFSAFQVGSQSADITYTLPTADGTSGFQLTTNGSGVLSWAAAQIALANDGNNRIVTGTGSAGLNAEASLTFDGSTLAVTGATTISTNLDVDGITNLDAVDIDGAVQIDATLSVGVDDTGYDVKLFGDTASAFMLWDASADDLILSGAAGLIVPDGQFTLGSTAITSTGAEINILDGGNAASSVTLVDADRIIVNDNGTMKQVAVSALNTYTSASIAADDISAGDAAVTITTSTGNITIDTAAGDADIIFKGTDDSADITALTLDMSAAGTAIFNNDVTVGDNLNLTTDSTVINFGADSDTTLTHTDGAGLTLNSTNKLMFNDASQFIQGASATVLDIAATDEIELTATLIEVVGNATVSGTLGVTGIVTFTDDIIIGDGKTIGSASDVDAITIAANGQLTLTQTLIGTALDISGDIDVDGTTNLDVVDIDGALTQDGGAVFNEASADVDFRIESDNDSVAFFVQGSDGKVGLGTGTPSKSLHLSSTTNAQPTVLIETVNAGASGGRLDFLHTSSSPADGDLLGDITFGGYSDSGTPPSDFSRYVMIKAFASDVSNNAEKGKLVISLHDGASNENNVDVLTIDGQAISTSSTLAAGGVVTANAGVVVDNITIDGTEIDLSSGDLLVDVAGDITLDAGGGNVKVAVAGTDILDIANSSSDVIIKPVVDAKDIIFQQRDGTSVLEINDGAYAKFTAAAVAPEATLTDASTVTWNALTQSVAKVTLGGNRTMGLASGGVTGAFISLLVIQDGTGSRTITWNAAYEFASDTAPTLTATANLGDLFVFRYNGAKWLEVGRNLALTLS